MPAAVTGFVPVPRGSSAPRSEEALGSGGQPEHVFASSSSEERGGLLFGPLQAYVDREGVTDVLVNGANDLWIDSGSGLERQTDWECPGEDRLRALAVRLIGLGGRHVDEANPCADVRIGSGYRVHVVLPPISRGGTLLSLRVQPPRSLGLDDLAERGLFGGDAEAPAVREYVESAIAQRRNLLISGPAGSGKTTLLAALLGIAPRDQRIIALEDVSELRVDHPHFIALEARQPNTEGAGALGLQQLLREALRMRPDRLILGECRGAEVFDLFAALNTGHDGGAGTLHANSLADVPARIEVLGALAGIDAPAIARLAASAIHLVVHLERRGPTRRIAALGTLALGREGRLEVTSVYGA